MHNLWDQNANCRIKRFQNRTKECVWKTKGAVIRGTDSMQSQLKKKTASTKQKKLRGKEIGEADFKIRFILKMCGEIQKRWS